MVCFLCVAFCWLNAFLTTLCLFGVVLFALCWFVFLVKLVSNGVWVLTMAPSYSSNLTATIVTSNYHIASNT